MWQVGFDECEVELQYNWQPYSELSVAAFCWYKMLIGAIRGEIWSLFNTERRISEIEGRGLGKRNRTERQKYWRVKRYRLNLLSLLFYWRILQRNLTSKTARGIKVRSCIWEVPGSSLGADIDMFCIFRIYIQSSRPNSSAVPPKKGHQRFL